MNESKKIKASEIIADIRAGMGNPELREKYDITAGALRDVLQRLIEAGLLKRRDFLASRPEPSSEKEKELETLAESLPPIPSDADGVQKDIPKAKTPGPSRYFPVMRLPIYELDDLSTEYRLEYFTEKGIKVVGLDARVGDKKSFVVQPDEFADVFPFVFEAECRWADSDPEKKFVTAGFDITSISKTGFDELSKLIRSVTIPAEEVSGG